MRNKLASALLIASIFVWGIWCGGQVFNELITVPKWSASPPESLKAYDALPSKGGLPFFPLFNPLFVVLAIGAAIAAWKSARRSRIWLALSAGTSIILFISLTFYLAPLVQAMFRHGVLVLGAGKNALRLAPPLVLSIDQANEVLRVFDVALTEVSRPAA